MQITVLPASAKTGQATVRALLSSLSAPSNLKIKGVYRDPSKAPEEFTSNPNFEAITGDFNDVASLTTALEGSDAVVVTIPPGKDPESDIVALAVSQAENVKAAVGQSGTVKKLVLVSTQGAQYDREQVGETLTRLHQVESVFSSSTCPSVAFFRCVYFMENWASSVPFVKSSPQPFFFTTITPVDWPMPMVAIKDIGIACADSALNIPIPTSTSPAEPPSTTTATAAEGAGVEIIELHGPRPYSSLDVKKAFEQVLGQGEGGEEKREVELRPIPREGLLPFCGQVFPHPNTAKRFADMMAAAIPGGGILVEDPEPTGVYARGRTELVEVLGEMFKYM